MVEFEFQWALVDRNTTHHFSEFLSIRIQCTQRLQRLYAMDTTFTLYTIDMYTMVVPLSLSRLHVHCIHPLFTKRCTRCVHCMFRYTIYNNHCLQNVVHVVNIQCTQRVQHFVNNGCIQWTCVYNHCMFRHVVNIQCTQRVQRFVNNGHCLQPLYV